MSQKSIVQLVTSSFDYNRLGYFLHGTAISSARILIQEGILPTGVDETGTAKYLYFIFNRPKYDLNPFAYNDGSGLAKIIDNMYGDRDWWTLELGRALLTTSPTHYLASLKEVLKFAAIYSRQKAEQIDDLPHKLKKRKNVQLRKGAVVSVNQKSIYDFPLELDPEDQGEEYTWSRAYLPEGLPISFVDNILVFSEEEFTELSSVFK